MSSLADSDTSDLHREVEFSEHEESANVDPFNLLGALEEENPNARYVVKLVVDYMEDDISSCFSEKALSSGIGDWEKFPPRVTFHFNEDSWHKMSTRKEESRDWAQRFFYAVPKGVRPSTMMLHCVVEQDRGGFSGWTTVARADVSLEDITNSWHAPEVSLIPEQKFVKEGYTAHTSAGNLIIKLKSVERSNPEKFVSHRKQGDENSSAEEGEEEDDTFDEEDDLGSITSPNKSSEGRKLASTNSSKRPRASFSFRNKKLTKAQKEEQAKLEEQQKLMESIEVKPGTYQVIIHVIEARSLKGGGGGLSSGIPDPMVKVEVDGESKNTRVLPQVENGVFDDTFKFEVNEVTAEQLARKEISISVIDTHCFLPGGILIGAFTTDLEMVYFSNKQHELYRQWIGLENTSHRSEVSVTGYLNVSITVLGPGEEAPHHDRVKEKKAEDAAKGSTGLVAKNVLTSGGRKQWEFLHVGVLQAVGLPAMDFGLFNRDDCKIDAFVQLAYSNIARKDLRTKEELIEGKSNLHCAWKTEFVIPVSVPSMVNRIDVAVYDKDFGVENNVMVASAGAFDLRDIRKSQLTQHSPAAVEVPDSPIHFATPFWAHLYGCPVQQDLSRGGNEKKKQELNEAGPKAGAGYRGSVLLTMNIQKPSSGFLSTGSKKTPRVEKHAIRSSIRPPHGVAHVVRVAAYSALSLQDRSDVFANGTRYSIKVCVGYAIKSSGSVIARAKEMREKPIINWLDGSGLIELGSDGEKLGSSSLIKWPSNAVPDIFVYLMRHKKLDHTGKGEDEAEPIGFSRFKCHDVWGLEEHHIRPRWVDFQPMPWRSDFPPPDPSKLDQHGPGSVLLRVGIDTLKEAQRLRPWELLDPKDTVNCHLYLHLYQGRDLPAADDNAKLDPYVETLFMGNTQRSTAHQATTNPQFNTSIVYKNLKLPRHPELTPPMFIGVLDHDNFSADDLVGVTKFPFASARQAVQCVEIIEADVLDHLLDVFQTQRQGTDTMSPVHEDEGKVAALVSADRVRSIRIKETTRKIEMAKSASDYDEAGFAALFTVYPDGNWLWLHLQDPIFEPAEVRESLIHQIEGRYFDLLDRLDCSAEVRELFERKPHVKIVDRLVFTDTGSIDFEDLNSKHKIAMAEGPTNDPSNFKKATRMSINPLLFSTDGRPTLSHRVMQHAFEHPERPHWYDLQDPIEPDRSCGQLLARFELVMESDWIAVPEIGSPRAGLEQAQARPTRTIQQIQAMIESPPPSVTAVYTEDRFIDIMVLGCRDLLSPDIFPLTNPFVEFRVGGQVLDKQNKKKFLSTPPSNKPTATNPNMLHRLIAPIQCPTDPTLCPNLDITVNDKRSGFLDVLIGTASFDLGCRVRPQYTAQKYNPIYRPPGVPTMEELEDSNPFVAGSANKKMRDAFRKRLDEMRKEKARLQREANEGIDSDGGVEETKGEEEGSRGQQEATKQEEEEAGLEVPEWRQGREEIYTEFERAQLTTNEPPRPYDTISLQRGSDFDAFATGVRKVGAIKMIVRVVAEGSETMEHDDRIDEWWDNIIEAHKSAVRPDKFMVRCYVLRAKGLEAKDLNGKSDPYVKVKLGNTTFSARDKHANATLNPDLYVRMEELITELPGTSTLEVSLWDYDLFTGDDHIGSTFIDVEDRWFSRSWQKMDRKPMEWRQLWSPTSLFPQGEVSMFLEVFRKGEAKLKPYWPIERPEPEEWEVRVIVWKTKNVPASDLGDFSDMYLRAFMIGNEHKAQTTDKHLRAQHGKGSFNWRMKFNVHMPLPTMSEATGRFVIQLWDWDFPDNDDCIGVSAIDLSKHLKIAFERNDAKRKDFVKKQAASPKGKVKVESFDKSMTPYYFFEESDQLEKRLKRRVFPMMKSSNKGSSGAALNLSHDERDGLISSSSNTNYNAIEAQPLNSNVKQAKPHKKKKKKQPKPPTVGEQLKDALGMGKPPPNSRWIPLSRKSGDTEKNAGEVLLSIELLPMALAKKLHNGLGRHEPNDHPVLPPPVGRMDPLQFSNPIYLCKTLIGDTLLREFAAVLCCVVLAMVVFITGPFFFEYFDWASSLGNDAGYWLLFAIVAGFIIFTCYVRLKCVRSMDFDPCFLCCPCCTWSNPSDDEDEDDDEDFDDEDCSDEDTGSV